MKKILLVVLILGAAYLVYWKWFKGEDNNAGTDSTQPLTVQINSGVFNISFDKMLNSYYSLKDGLVAEDTVKVNSAASQLVQFADSLALDEIKGDSTGDIKSTALNFTGTIAGSSKALAAEPTLEAKRKEFEMITDALYNLIRVVKYDGNKVYYLFCPMAFDDKGAYWLSNESQIRNPYFGKKMLTCGNVVDSLHYGGN
jgi:Cu(I)/Ag(I) efflux system membrane fusion protein